MAGIGIFKSLKIYVFGTLAAWVIRIIYATIRWEVLAPERADEDRQVIYAFWHGRMLMLPEHYRRLKGRPPLYMLISQHGDGRLIAFAIKLLGIRSVAGSSTRRGMAATLELVRRLQEGVAIGITPDGPKGPRQVCKRGVVTMARHSGVAIRPVTYSTEEHWVLPSWDRMIVPRPFSKGVVVFGELLTPAPDGDEEEFRLTIEESLNAITERADAHWRPV